MAKSKYTEHLPIITVVCLVALIFVIYLVSFQVENSEHAIVLRFGSPTEREVGPGLHGKAPWPIDRVWTVSNRIQYFEGEVGAIEEVQTKDRKNINVTTFVLFRVADKNTPVPPGATSQAGADHTRFFMQKLGKIDEARKKLTALVRSHRSAVIGQYDFAEMVTTEVDADGKPLVKLDTIEQEILARVKVDALDLYGIEVTGLGFKHIGLPDTVTQQVFERMRADRERESKRIAAEGKALAEQISRKADTEYNRIVQQANADAKQTKSEGDAAAANLLSAFNENPELAAFILKLESLERLTAGHNEQDRFTFVVDPTIPPFDVLQPGTLEKIREAALNPPPAPANP